jgi:hypothetical protein
MFRALSGHSGAWLLAGLVQGQPSYAVATDHADDFAIATGPLTNELEAVYLLDFKSGRLMGSVLNRQAGKFQAFYERNLASDFNLAARAKPKFIMVTGVAQVARAQVPINHCLYVAEVNSGKMAAYFMPYRGDRAGGVASDELQVLDVIPFRQGAVARPQ